MGALHAASAWAVDPVSPQNKNYIVDFGPNAKGEELRPLNFGFDCAFTFNDMLYSYGNKED